LYLLHPVLRRSWPDADAVDLRLPFVCCRTRALNDWCCFYYAIRNSLVALLEALFARFFWRFEISVCWNFFFVCARHLPLTKIFLRPSQLSSYALLSPFLLGADNTFVLARVCLYMCEWKCVIKVVNIHKYKQNRDNVTCNIHVETERDVHTDVKQAVKWQVFRHVTEYNTNK